MPKNIDCVQYILHVINVFLAFSPCFLLIRKKNVMLLNKQLDLVCRHILLFHFQSQFNSSLSPLLTCTLHPMLLSWTPTSLNCLGNTQVRISSGFGPQVSAFTSNVISFSLLACHSPVQTPSHSKEGRHPVPSK